MGVGIRNWLFDVGLLSSKKYDLPIISVGNITVGGTGKTPHTEYLLKLLSPIMKVAMLSRGYKRTTRGFILADESSDCDSIGDEPFQILQKYKENVVVAVDGNRCRGIENLLASDYGPELGAIVLDDAFQHRFVQPGISILLTDYNRLITSDRLLPIGNLREPASNRKRANIVIVTKCPETAQPIDYRLVTKTLSLYPYQNLYFSKYVYKELIPVFASDKTKRITKELILKEKYELLVFTGIVSQQHLIDYLHQYTSHLQAIEYPDHHFYTEDDLIAIENKFKSIERAKKIIITTEKDAARLVGNRLFPESVKEFIYMLPIEVTFLFDQEKLFNEQILGYVSKNKTNRSLFRK